MTVYWLTIRVACYVTCSFMCPDSFRRMGNCAGIASDPRSRNETTGAVYKIERDAKPQVDHEVEPKVEQEVKAKVEHDEGDQKDDSDSESTEEGQSTEPEAVRVKPVYVLRPSVIKKLDEVCLELIISLLSASLFPQASQEIEPHFLIAGQVLPGGATWYLLSFLTSGDLTGENKEALLFACLPTANSLPSSLRAGCHVQGAAPAGPPIR